MKRLALMCIMIAGVMAVEADMLTVTAYCACKKCCGPNAKGMTASGKRPVEGRTVAASRNIPLGTRVHIEGVGWRTVEDRLAKRYDNRVDLYFDSHKDALSWGIKQREIVIGTK